MIRRIALLFLFVITAAISACGKPDAAQPDSATPVAPSTRQENTKAEIDEAAQIASLIDPAKLGTLRERGANPRIQKITAILATAKAHGKKPEEITQLAVEKIGWGDTQKGNLTESAILRNLRIAEQLGATTPEDIENMRRGRAATVRRGPYAGDILSVDHIIPRSVSPELDNTIANLELMPLRVNQRKGNTIGARQRDLARKLHAAGLMENPELPN